MDDTVEFYLASIWQYQDAGVDRVLSFLRAHHAKGEYSYEKADNWFKVSCDVADVGSVQAIFRQVHDQLESSMKDEKIPRDNPFLKVPTPGDLPMRTPDKVVVDQVCPVSFDRYSCKKVWTRVKDETPDTISVQTFLSEEDRQAIMASSGAHAAFDTAGRLVYLGGPTKVCVDKASKMLDNMFGRFTFVMPPVKHLLYAEAEGLYRVDARFMAHVNEGMLTSTILDPGQYPDALLDSTFKAVFARAVCLRICLFDRFKRTEVSFFGPKVQPIFHDQARQWPMWLRKAEYAPKALGVTAPKKSPEVVVAAAAAAVQEPQASEKQSTPRASQGNELVDISNGNGVANDANTNSSKSDTAALSSLAEQLDLLAGGIPSPEKKSAPDLLAVDILDLDNKTAPALPSAPALDFPDTPSPPPPQPSLPSFDSDQNGYQMRLLWEFAHGHSKKTNPHQNKSRPASSAGAKASASRIHYDDKVKTNGSRAPDTEQLITVLEDQEATLIDTAPTETAKTKQDTMIISIDAPTETTETPQNGLLIPVDSPTEATEAEQNALLIPIDAPPPPPATPATSEWKQGAAAASRKKSHSAAGGTNVSKALVRRSLFADSLCKSIGRLTADLPCSRGRIRLQVELGRIYIMDASPEGLAYNHQGEPSSGWLHTEILTRLDTHTVSPQSAIFTRALTLFANDIESVVLGTATAAASSSAAAADLFGESPPPEWSFREKRVVYEFTCQRAAGAAKVVQAAPFVVEVDGTEAGAFTYALRRPADARPPILVHCIRRHWDARVVVSYSDTAKLEKAYGEFARELLRTMVVPPGPATAPKFQVGYDHRETTSRPLVTRIVSARVRNEARFASADGESFLDVAWVRHMALEARPDKQTAGTGVLRAAPAADDPSRGLFASWYEASISSARAEAAFRENETLPVGGVAAWGRSRGNGGNGNGSGSSSGAAGGQDEMYEAAFGPALRLVQKMDGVGVLIDNGQGDRQWTPPMRAQGAAKAPEKFW